MLIGAHVSIAGGLPNAPLNAEKIGCEVFQVFTHSPRGGKILPISAEVANEFKVNCKKCNQAEWYVHAPYYINFASKDNKIRHGSRSAIREELDRADMLGAKFLMTHLGSYTSLGYEAGFAQVIDGLDEALRKYTGKTKFLIEISAGASGIIGGTFEQIAEIIHHPKLAKYKIGVCYDTQHGFASGYDIRTTEAVRVTFEKFEQIIGLENLKMSHCNDSLTGLGSNKDRHAHIGEGQIGIEGFKALFENKKLKNINFICETEHDKVVKDISLLKSLCPN